MKKTNPLPRGWDEKKVRRVLRHYERQTPAQAAAEDERTYRNRKQTLMSVPVKLVAEVRKLIARRAG